MVVNFVLHCLNVGLAVIVTNAVVKSLWKAPNGGLKPEFTEFLCFAAAVTGAHPLRAETVCWASCTSYLVCCFFCLLSIYTHVQHRAARPLSGSFGFTLTFLKVLSLFFFFLAVYSKAACITVAGLIMLFDACSVFMLKRGTANTPPPPSPITVGISILLDNALLMAIIMAGIYSATRASATTKIEHIHEMTGAFASVVVRHQAPSA